MDNMTAFASIILAVVFYLTIFSLTTVLLYFALSKYIDKKKQKYALILVEKGFKIETFDSRGVPHLLSKNKVVVTAWHGKENL